MVTKPRRETDAAREFSKLMNKLVAHKASDSRHAHIVLGELLHPTNISSPAILAYSTINRRVDALLDLVNGLDDDRIDDETRDLSINAIESIHSMFSAENMYQSWNGVLNNHLRK